MRKHTPILTLSLFSLFFAFDGGLRAQKGAQLPPKRHRVAVLDFNDSAVMTSSQAAFDRQVDVGKGISDLLTGRLVSDGTYRVIERSQLDKILTEPTFLNSNLSDPETAAKIEIGRAHV